MEGGDARQIHVLSGRGSILLLSTTLCILALQPVENFATHAYARSFSFHGSLSIHNLWHQCRLQLSLQQAMTQDSIVKINISTSALEIVVGTVYRTSVCFCREFM